MGAVSSVCGSNHPMWLLLQYDEWISLSHSFAWFQKVFYNIAKCRLA